LDTHDLSLMTLFLFFSVWVGYVILDEAMAIFPFSSVCVGYVILVETAISLFSSVCVGYDFSSFREVFLRT